MTTKATERTFLSNQINFNLPPPTESDQLESTVRQAGFPGVWAVLELMNAMAELNLDRRMIETERRHDSLVVAAQSSRATAVTIGRRQAEIIRLTIEMNGLKLLIKARKKLGSLPEQVQTKLRERAAEQKRSTKVEK